MASLLPDIELDEAVPEASFSELHSRVVQAPIQEVWRASLDVTAREIRTLGPLMALRSLPHRLTGTRPISTSVPRRVLDVFTDEHFVLLRRDEVPRQGRAVVIFGAAGKFWSITGNAPLPFEDAQAFLDFKEPGYAKTVARVEAVDLGNGMTRIETETVITGTDRASTRKFAPYWALIRLPSGLIRRSWLGAIDRRARRATT